MYTKILTEEVMSTILPKDFPETKLSQPKYNVKLEKDVYVKMRDGVRVAIDVYRPDAPGKFPALYASSPYQKNLIYLPQLPQLHMRETNDIDWFVQRGYVYVHADIRGCGVSEGMWRFHSKEEQNDHYDLIEWMAQQPWCNSRVGMFGESYYAWTQWSAAATQPPHLVTIVPYDAGADMYRDVVYHCGIPTMGFLTAWHFDLRANHLWALSKHQPDTMRWDLQYECLEHPTYDDFWEERNPDFKKIKCSVFSIGIWHKVGIHLRGNTRGYEEVETPKKLMLCHGDFEGDEMAIFNSRELRLEMLRWYDHWLKDNDTGIMNEPPVNLFIRGDNRYRVENEWPLQRTQYTKFYLNPGPIEAARSLNNGGLSQKEPTVKESSFQYEYPNPDWTQFSGLGTGLLDKGIPNPTAKILTFTSDPMEEDLEVTGAIILMLYASSTEKDAEFCVRLVDQVPDSEQHPDILPPMGRILTRGWLKASHREKDEKLSRSYRPYYTHKHPTPIEPNKVYKYEIEIWPTTNVFKKGHRIRLDLACTDSNAFDFGGHVYGIKVGKDTIYHDKDHPSHLILPVIPR